MHAPQAVLFLDRGSLMSKRRLQNRFQYEYEVESEVSNRTEYEEVCKVRSMEE